MQNKIDPKIQPLLDELTEKCYLVRQKEIAKMLEPYYDSVIPLFIERLKYQGDKYHIKYNAKDMLALSADPRGILPLIRQLEMSGGWTGGTFKLIRESLQEKDDFARKKVNNQLIQYLEEGPEIPIRKPFDAVADEIPEHHYRIAEVIDILAEFGGLQDPRFEALLRRYIKDYRFYSIATQRALSALARIDPDSADSYLGKISISGGGYLDTNNVRVVSTKMDYGRESIFFNICIRGNNVPKWNEEPYLFLFEKELVFFLASGEEGYKWFAGKARNINDAIQAATNYLKHRPQHIRIKNTKKIEISHKYSRVHHAEKYSELVELLEKHLDFDRWGFKQSYISPKSYPTIIYDSEWCRVKFSLHSGDRYEPDELSVQYGRLHAPSNDSFMVFNGEKCWCWHWDYYFLPFLDGISPQEKAKSYASSPVIEQYRKSELAQQLSPGPAWGIGKQAAIWEYYGQRLFDLFDLRNPELWKQYNDFIKELYTIKDRRSSPGNPPMDKIC